MTTGPGWCQIIESSYERLRFRRVTLSKQRSCSISGGQYRNLQIYGAELSALRHLRDCKLSWRRSPLEWGSWRSVLDEGSGQRHIKSRREPQLRLSSSWCMDHAPGLSRWSSSLPLSDGVACTLSGIHARHACPWGACFSACQVLLV